MPIRNPFAKRTDIGLQPTSDENAPARRPSFEKVSTVGSRASSLSINTGKNEEPPEYKMSVVNDSGVYLPPSPPEKKSFWPRKGNLSVTSINTRNASSDDIDPFPISRESFDSYRRSFDISARSPISPVDGYMGRQSLDSARLPRMQRSAIGGRFEGQPPTAEEGFEDVGLNDESLKQQQQQQQQVKKKGFFARIGDDTFHMPGRKRGQSGTGQELGSISTPSVVTPAAEAGEVH